MGTVIMRAVCLAIIAGAFTLFACNAAISARNAHRRGMERVRAFNQSWEADRAKRNAMARRALAERRGPS